MSKGHGRWCSQKLKSRGGGRSSPRRIITSQLRKSQRNFTLPAHRQKPRNQQLLSPGMTPAPAWPSRKYVNPREMKSEKVQGRAIGEEEGKSLFYFFTASEEKRSREETIKNRPPIRGPSVCYPSLSFAGPRDFWRLTLDLASRSEIGFDSRG